MPQERHGIKKTLQSDSTAIINSLLRTPGVVCSEKLTNGEQVEAGLFQLIDGPLKILYGTGMMAAGVLLAPIPCVVVNVKTHEIQDGNGIRAEITGVGLSLRKPKSPLHYKRYATSPIGNGRHRVTETTGVEMKFRFGIPDPHKHETLPSGIQSQHVVVDAKTTVTGYGLFTTGVGRVIAGACDPIFGLGKAGYYGIASAKEAIISSRQNRP